MPGCKNVACFYHDANTFEDTELGCLMHDSLDEVGKCRPRGKYDMLMATLKLERASRSKEPASISQQALPGGEKPAQIKPVVVCLCGSTRFYEAFRKANFDETLANKIVLTIGCDFKSDDDLGLTDADKTRLDELHKRKIDLADEVLILNVGGYIGSSTRSELNYAIDHGKEIRYLENCKPA